MDAYELPEEFAHLQAQDMSKIGFISDVVRGIKKVVTPEEPKQTVVKETVTVGANSNTASLLERVFMFLEDGDWNSANEYCEKVLDIEPKCAEAYLGKLMAELCVKEQDALKNIEEPFNDNNNYQKAIRFGDEKLKSELQGYIEFINERNEEERLNAVYAKAINQMNTVTTEEEFKATSIAFDSIKNYKDAKELAEECLKKAENAKKDSSYNRCLRILEKGETASINELEQVYESLNKLNGYKDSKQKADECSKMIEAIKAKNEQERIEKIQKEEQERIEREKQAEAERIEREKQEQAEREAKARIAKRNKKIAIITTPIVCVVIAFIIVLNTVIIPNNKYNEAIALMDVGKYEDAIQLFNDVLGIKDAKEKLLEAKEKLQEALEKKREATEAYSRTIALGSHHTIGLKTDKTVVSTKYTGSSEHYHGECEVQGWKDIIAISAGTSHTVGLKSDGTVVSTKYTGSSEYYHNQCEVQSWKDIVAISSGSVHTVGLKSDGTVVATKYTGDWYSGQCDVLGWEDIIAISAGESHTVGLKSDGTVVTTKLAKTTYIRDQGQFEVQNWKDMVAISAGNYHTVGLKSDGTVVAVGSNFSGQCNVNDWRNMVAISAGNHHTVGLKSDGTVVAVGSNSSGQCNVNDWRDIVAISVGLDHTVGLKSDGTVVATGMNEGGQCVVQNWNLFK